MDERKAFEAWARDNVGQPSFAGKHVRDGAWSYNHNFMDAHWRAWQAATAAERERCAKAVDNWMRREDMTGDDIRKV